CEANVRDAISALEACPSPPPHAPLHNRLLQRLDVLCRELPQRARALEELGGPETLLHGDLWAINVFVIPTPNGLHARLIDWDHAASGDLKDYAHLHQVRIQGKRLRYAMEVFADCFAADFKEELYPQIEEMQEILGSANDSHVGAQR